MTQRSTVMITTAPAGSGKTYVRGPRFLCDEFLREGEGVHYSNLPLHVDKIGVFMERLTGGKLTAEKAESRLFRIPESEIDLWMKEQSGPWEYFAEADLQAAHIAIDECHNVCGSKHSTGHRKRWGEWLGEIRHRGATVELISQDPDKIAREVQLEAAKRLVLMNGEERRDPWFKVLMGDWYELRAGFITGEYTAKVWCFEKRKVDGSWVESHKKTFAMEPEYFELYDSYSRPHGGGKKAEAPDREFQRRTKAGLLAWFLRRNSGQVLWRLAAVLFLVWVCFGGGALILMGALQSKLSSMAPGGKKRVEEQQQKEPEAAAIERLAALPPDELQHVVGSLQRQVSDLRNERTALSQMADELTHEFGKLAEKVGESFTLEMVNEDAVQFRNGYRYSVGEKIDWGPYEGRKLVAVDWKRRTARLDDGSLLRLGDPQSQSNGGLLERFSGSEPIEAGMGGPLPTSGRGGAPGGSERYQEGRPSAASVHRGYAPAEVPKMDQQRSGRLSDRRGGPRQSQRDG